jgi:5-methylcytosine-specific restriction protein A
LESLINELDGFELIPRVAFEIAVRDQIERPPTIAPLGTLAPGRTITTSTSVIRDAAVKAWVIGRANGVCECCGCPAPFESTVGIGFLEVHHLKTLADGGSDTISNAAAVCPNCHRRMHFGKDAAAMKNQTTARVPGLKLE